MNVRTISAEQPVGAGPASEAGTRLRGVWLALARAAWITYALLVIGLNVQNTPARLVEMSDIPPEEVQALVQFGLTPYHHGLYHVVTEHLLSFASAAIAIALFLKKSDDWMVMVISAFLIGIGPPFLTMEFSPRWLLELVLFVASLEYILLFIFPDGRFVPRWTRYVALFWIAWSLGMRFFPALDPAKWPAPGVGQGGVGLAAFIWDLGYLGSGILAQVYRYLRVSTPVQRQQTKWALFGLAVLYLGYVLAYLPEHLFPELAQPGMPHLVYRTLRKVVLITTRFMLPLSVAIAVLRYRLWDIDLILNRSLVYSGLTASTMGIYVLVVGSFGALFQAGSRTASADAAIPFLATGLVAILFQPLRLRIQRGVNRLMYGERDDPYAVVSRLSRRLEATLSPAAVLPAIVETVAQALKLPYAAIALREDEARPSVGRSSPDGEGPPQVSPPEGDRFQIVTAWGQPVGGLVHLPLIFQSEVIGQLILAPRAPGDAFSPADRRLLEDIAGQAGAAVHAVRLNADLQRSRERLVTAQEEERRRLRRDLHDGLGPALASQGLKLAAARQLLGRDPAAADRLLSEVMGQSEATVAEIRRLVYALRPPALDELGLVGAIRDHAFGTAGSASLPAGLDVTVEELPAGLPPLPAAVEVAAYRIVLEALTNVARHARAGQARVRFSLQSWEAERFFQIEVEDDGAGLPEARRSGVGLRSMRERAEELGGTISITSPPGDGTRLTARFPLASIS
jgi:signal transduction histidine kinase